MSEIDTLEKESAEEKREIETWNNFPNYKPVPKPEMSHQPYWFDLPKSGGGDVDLADYALNFN